MRLQAPVSWEDLNSRARGLSGRLLTRGQLRSLAESSDLPALAEALSTLGYLPSDLAGTVSPEALDLASRRLAGARLETLARWARGRAAPLAVVFEDEDRRSLRALLRGAVQGASAELRTAGLIPTPRLPERVLEELARLGSPGAIAALLVSWGDPYGSAVLREARSPQPDLFRLETAVNRTYASRALAAAKRGGRRLVAYVQDSIDLENAAAVLGLVGQGSDVPSGECFLVGGVRLDRKAFEAATALDDLEAVLKRLVRVFAHTPYAAVFESRAGDPEAMEQAWLETRIEALFRDARREPLGPAPLLLYGLRLRREVTVLRRVIWGVALGAPGGELAGGEAG